MKIFKEKEEAAKPIERFQRATDRIIKVSLRITRVV